ncbi:response regulator transcription factor [Geitlerinema sp. P-1104]|uniref:response regulator transcription factor n=1 Tax=Geitlerinema sp. P-1104 TaxID=2546230 RepID=UPI0014776F83|nr:response regulator transcription factor [Geitlerinema sp. P-1104]NMG59301.1 response regulator transcription factor [Geitlerinema sp. P-1104]
MPLTILVVEDDVGTRLSITDYLELSGYLAVPAVNGREAMGLLDRHQPHLLITDAIMPEMDGYELVRQVRQQPSFRLLPVIFLTARNETHDRIRGYQAGIDIHMPKPFELEELAAVVRNFLDRYTMMSHASTVAPPALAPEQPDVTIDLTDREQEVLDLLSQGLSNNQIGDRLYLSSRTIEKYVSNLLRKTETSNRSELVRFAIEHHLLQD